MADAILRTKNHTQRKRTLRTAAAAVELALVLPFLLTVFVASVDFARAFYNTQVITDCARTAALFLANPDLAEKTVLKSEAELVAQCFKDLTPKPTIVIARGVDKESHAYVEVTISQDFALICPLIFKPKYNLTRTARARLYPAALDERGGND